MPKSHSTNLPPGATARFATRLARDGAMDMRPEIAGKAAQISQSNDRKALLNGADIIVGELRDAGVSVSKDLILEGLAAARGLKNWDTLSAQFPNPKTLERRFEGVTGYAGDPVFLDGEPLPELDAMIVQELRARTPIDACVKRVKAMATDAPLDWGADSTKAQLGDAASAALEAYDMYCTEAGVSLYTLPTRDEDTIIVRRLTSYFAKTFSYPSK